MSILNIGHRGYSAKYPENTLLAFRKAFEVGADGIECDLRLSRDNQIVIFHDDTFSRLCGSSKLVEETDLSEMKELKIMGSEPVCRLNDLLTEFGDRILNLEIKASPRYADLSTRLLELLDELQPSGEILISSFCTKTLQFLQNHQTSSKLKLGLVFLSPDEENFKEMKDSPGLSTWNMRFDAFKKHLSANSWKWPEKNFWLWTLNDKRAWSFAQEHSDKVRAIITDDPESLNAFLR